MAPRTLTLVGSDALFIALSLLLVRSPELAPALYPFYGLVFLWSDLRRENEVPIIFLFLVTAAGLFLGARAPHAQQTALFFETAGMWALVWALARQRAAALQGERAATVEQLALESRMRDDERDLKYYRAYQESAGGQIRLRRDLAESAKSLGSTMDAQEVRARLTAILSARFPGARVEIAASPAGDPLLEWTARRKAPVVVKDAGSDERFSAAGWRSALAVPLRMNRQAAGFLRVTSDKPGAFGSEDAQAVDLFGTMAAMSLENIQFYEQVHLQATHDPLTQLHSHKAFQGRLQEELLRAGRSQTPLSLIMCDIDHFKRYNDGYGHQAGDHLLRTVAAILSSFARPVDFVARYGGEEFSIILPNFVRSEAVQLAERIRSRLASEPFVFQGQTTGATMSFGVASFPQDATTASQMVRSADERLYKAKHGGRNQVVG